MTLLLACTRSGTCQADSTCHHPSCFQALLTATAGTGDAPVRHATEACTRHLVNAVQAVTVWAHQHQLTSGHVTVVALDPPPPGTIGRYDSPTDHDTGTGLALCTIPLSDQPL